MKKQSLNKNILKRILILSIMIIITMVTSTYAVELKQSKISEAYLEWLKLPEEEKVNTIQPKIYDVIYDEETQGIIGRIQSYEQVLYTISLPDKYNLKNDISIKVEDQETTGACWAFGTTSAIETTLAKKYKDNSYQLSVAHMEYATIRTFLDGTNTKGFERNVNQGGNPNVAIPYTMNGTGMVLESDMPFENYYEKIAAGTSINLTEIDKDSVVKVKGYTDFPSIYKQRTESGLIYIDSSLNNQYSSTEVNKIRDKIKEHIYTTGGITAGMYYPDTTEIISNCLAVIKTGTEYTTSVYIPNYITTGSGEPNITGNHEVIIVGWDDTFSKNNFKTKPTQDGAYICLNSHGTNLGTYTVDGYIYISYDDVYIENWLVGIDDVDKTDEADVMYQHDFYGMTYYVTTEEETTYGKNVFNKATTEREFLTDISVGMASTGTVELYTILDGGTAKKLDVNIGTLEPGYHNIKLSKPIEITASNFSIIAKVTGGLGVEIPLTEVYSSSPYKYASSNAGESYISSDGVTYTDLKTANLSTQVGSYTINYNNANLCIKATTTTNIPVEKIELDKSTLQLTEGKTETLTATITPTEASNKKINWTSDKEIVATVDTTGKVTAIAEGTAIITATTEDGEKTATCTVTVNPIKITLNKKELTLIEEETETLVATITPADVANQLVNWTSDKETVAIVNNQGKVTAISEGTAVITATTGNKTATCTVTVISKDSLITSTKYKVNNLEISKISPNTNKTQFLNNITTIGETVKIYDGDREITSNTETMKTGMKITTDEKIYYTIIVSGDINGDGQCNLIDLSKMKLYTISVEKITGEFLKAADVNDDEKANLIDLSNIKLYNIGIKNF